MNNISHFILAYEEYLANKKNVISIPQMEDLEDVFDYIDDKTQACTDQTNKVLEKTVVSQLTRIGTLREEVNEKSVTMELMKKNLTDLLNMCKHCRSTVSKGLGYFQKMFGSTSNCDFNAYAKKHFKLFD